MISHDRSDDDPLFTQPRTITWAADGNIDGQKNWADQVSWAAGLSRGGVVGWRLPIGNPFYSSSFNTALGSSDLQLASLSEDGVFQVSIPAVAANFASELPNVGGNDEGELKPGVVRNIVLATYHSPPPPPPPPPPPTTAATARSDAAQCDDEPVNDLL